MNPKAEIKSMLQNSLSVALDNLYRANRQFSNISPGEYYGESGRLCADILRGYVDDVEKLNECIRWIESR